MKWIPAVALAVVATANYPSVGTAPHGPHEFSAGGSIEGTVTDSAGAGLDCAWVYAYPAGDRPDESSEAPDEALTSPDGTYEIGGLGPGEYVVGFWSAGEDCVGVGEFYFEYYDDARRWRRATPVTVLVGKTEGVDAALVRMGVIRGRIRDAAGRPVRAWVSAYRASDSQYSYIGVETDRRGRYILSSLEPGRYRVFASANSRRHSAAWYGGDSYAEASVLRVRDDTVLRGISLTLR